MVSFDTNSIRDLNPPELVFDKLGLSYVRKGPRLLADCPGCGKANKFDYNVTKDVYYCFSGGCEFGRDRRGVIDFVMDVLGRDFVEACKFLGGAKELTPSEKRAAETRQKERAETAKRAEANHLRRTKKQMEKILEGCQPGEGSLAQTYLETRGHALGLAALGWPADIVFHPGLEAFVGEGPDKTAAGTFPTMIAKGRDAKGKLVLLHRTYLEPDGQGGMKKAAPTLPEALARQWNAKQMLGVLGRCDSGVYLGATVGVTDDPRLPVISAEGIESTLAMATAGCHGAFYAALSLDRLIGGWSPDGQTMRGWRPPERGRPVILACDNDLAPVKGFEDFEEVRGKKVSAARAEYVFEKAGQRLANAGHKTGLWFPPLGCDPEDTLFIDPETENPNEKDFQGSINNAPQSVPGADAESNSASSPEAEQSADQDSPEPTELVQELESANV